MFCGIWFASALTKLHRESYELKFVIQLSILRYIAGISKFWNRRSFSLNLFPTITMEDSPYAVNTVQVIHPNIPLAKLSTLTQHPLSSSNRLHTNAQPNTLRPLKWVQEAQKFGIPYPRMETDEYWPLPYQQEGRFNNSADLVNYVCAFGEWVIGNILDG